MIEAGDPFESRERPLYLAIASDCAGLRPSTLRALTSLSLLPGVRVDVMPALAGMSTEPTKLVAWSGQSPDYHVTTTREPQRTYLIQTEEDWVRLAEDFLKLDRPAAERIVLEARIFEALGYDYLVCPRLTTGRDRSRRAWPNWLGAVTPEEAFRLAGAKARMYGMLPEGHDTGIRVYTTIGRTYDQAATKWTPGLIAALAGAVGSRDPAESGTVPFLLGIRARINQLLVARDEVYRLTRREALGLRGGSRTDEEKAPARKGNDLRESLAYHATAAMDAAFAAGDALAWVAAVRDGGNIGHARAIGLGQLLGGTAKWTSGTNACKVRAALQASADQAFTLAVRELRNRNVHRDGLSHGRLIFHPPVAGPEPSVVWVDLETFGGHSRADDLLRAIADRADYADDGLAVLTFLRLVDEIWCSTARLISCALKSMAWGDRSWLRAEGGRKDDLDGRWRTHTQRLLWAIPKRSHVGGHSSAPGLP